MYANPMLICRAETKGCRSTPGHSSPPLSRPSIFPRFPRPLCLNALPGYPNIRDFVKFLLSIHRLRGFVSQSLPFSAKRAWAVLDAVSYNTSKYFSSRLWLTHCFQTSSFWVYSWHSKFPDKTYRITYVSDPFSYRIGVVFIRLCMNPIRSAPTTRYNFAPHQQVARKWIRYNPYRFASRVGIVIRYETLQYLALIIGWLQCKSDWSIAWQIGKENNKYGGRNEIILAQNSVTGLFSSRRVNTHTPEQWVWTLELSGKLWKRSYAHTPYNIICDSDDTI